MCYSRPNTEQMLWEQKKLDGLDDGDLQCGDTGVGSWHCEAGKVKSRGQFDPGFSYLGKLGAWPDS